MYPNIVGSLHPSSPSSQTNFTDNDGHELIQNEFIALHSTPLYLIIFKNYDGPRSWFTAIICS